jgi:predicted nucleic acid-binding protein
MTLRVLDASVVIKCLVLEDGSDEALALLNGDVAVPDFLVVECANVLWRKRRLGELADGEVHDGWAELDRFTFDFTADRLLAPAARQLAVDLGHPVHDCLYLALALRRSATLTTADRRFQHAAAAAGYGGMVGLLGATA